MKSLVGFCLRRPIAVTAFATLLVVLGLVAYARLPVSLLPDLRYPALVIWTSYPDVPPDQVEQAVTERLEAAVAGTEGVVRVTSRSRLGGSLIRLDFGWNVDLDMALLDVRRNMDRLWSVLPQEASRPVVLRLDPGDRPIMMIALRQTANGPDRIYQSPEAPADSLARQDLVGLKRVGRDVIARRLEQHRDIARVRVTGGYERRIEIAPDAGKLAIHRIGIDRIGAALRASNVALSGGMIRHGPFRYAVEVSGEFRTANDVAATVVTNEGGIPVRLRDVAVVRESVEERRGLVRLDGEEALLLLVERRVEANTVRAAREARVILEELEAELPGAQLDVVVDESVFIRQAIGSVTQAVLLGGLLAMMVLFAFLRRVRILLAVAVAVPLSLCITLILFELFDVTFNLISLSGLALGVGMLVDNAIIVVENISRLREEGMPPFEAARSGVIEVAGAITASTLTTIAVFIPITFVEGLPGRLFRDQAVAVTCSLAASLLVALTVVPLLAVRGVRDEVERGEKDAPTRFGNRITSIYERALATSLRHRGAVIGTCLLLLFVSAWVTLNLPREVVPRTNQGRTELHMKLPSDADLPLVSMRSAALETNLFDRGLMRHVLADLGERDEARLDLDPRLPYEGDLILVLEKGIDVDDVAEAVASTGLAADMGVEVKPVRTQLETIVAPDEADLLIDLVSERRVEADSMLHLALSALQSRSELANVRQAHGEKIPVYQLTFRRDNLARFQVEPATIATYLEAAGRGRRASELRTVNEEIPIVIRAYGIDSIQRLLAEHVPTPRGLMPIGEFVAARLVELPSTLVRIEQTPVVRIIADVSPIADLASASEAVVETLTGALPPYVRVRVGGATEAFRDGLYALGSSLLLSLLLVYLILAAQFESLVQPLVILSTLPLAVAGVACVVGLTGHTINLMSLTGCVVLVGIVVNDAIVKVDFINQQRSRGMPLEPAVLAAGRNRLRPILMTTITTILGLTPLALGLGEGAELRAPLAIAIIGGLASATVLTLFVVPVLYTLTVGRKQDSVLSDSL